MDSGIDFECSDKKSSQPPAIEIVGFVCILLYANGRSFLTGINKLICINGKHDVEAFESVLPIKWVRCIDFFFVSRYRINKCVFWNPSSNCLSSNRHFQQPWTIAHYEVTNSIHGKHSGRLMTNTLRNGLTPFFLLLFFLLACSSWLKYCSTESVRWNDTKGDSGEQFLHVIQFVFNAGTFFVWKNYALDEDNTDDDVDDEEGKSNRSDNSLENSRERVRYESCDMSRRSDYRRRTIAIVYMNDTFEWFRDEYNQQQRYVPWGFAHRSAVTICTLSNGGWDMFFHAMKLLHDVVRTSVVAKPIAFLFLNKTKKNHIKNSNSTWKL